MAQQQILVRVLPPNELLGKQLYARNLSTGSVRMIPHPGGGVENDNIVIGMVAPGAWFDTTYKLGTDNTRIYTAEV